MKQFMLIQLLTTALVFILTKAAESDASDSNFETILERLNNLEKEFIRISETKNVDKELKDIIMQQDRRIQELSDENNRMKSKIKELDEFVSNLKRHTSFTKSFNTKRSQKLSKASENGNIDKMSSKRSMSAKMDVSLPAKQTAQYGTTAFTAIADQMYLDLQVYDKIPFGDVQLNDGNAYNGTTGVFICPKSGLYMFSFHIFSAATSGYGGKEAGVWLAVNGGPVLITEETTTTDDEICNLHGTFITRLNVNDQVWVGVGLNGTVVMFAESYFTGVHLTG